MGANTRVVEIRIEMHKCRTYPVIEFTRRARGHHRYSSARYDLKTHESSDRLYTILNQYEVRHNELDVSHHGYVIMEFDVEGAENTDLFGNL